MIGYIVSDIGRIPKDAKIMDLEECVSMIIDHRGKTPKKLGSDWVNKGIPAISAKNVHNGKLDNKESIRFVTQEVYEIWMKEDVKKGDCFLVSEGATLGEFLYWDYDYPIVLSQRLFCIRTNPEILYSKYFYAYMGTTNFHRQVLNRATGSSVGGLRQSEVLKLKVPVIPLDCQMIIGNLLYNLDKKVRLLCQQNETLEQMAQTLFKRWFVDFEFPNEQGQPYRSAGGEMVASELGEIPLGWEWGTLGELATNKASTFKFSEKNVVFINTGDVLEGKFLHQNYSNPKALPGQAKKAIEQDDILYSEIRPKNKRFAFVDFNSEDYVVSTKFMIIRTKGGLCQKILYLILKTQRNIDEINNIAESRSGTFPQITFDAISDFKIIKAPMNIQYNFLNLLEVIMEKQKNNTNEIQTLTKLRDTLLPKLMSGEIRVPTTTTHG